MQKKPTRTKATAARETRSATTQTTTTQETAPTRAELSQSLANSGSRIPASEEKALRMLHGLQAPRTLVLDRVGQNQPEARAQLLDIELSLLRQSRARAAKASARAVATPAANPRRAAIVAALKAKKTR